MRNRWILMLALAAQSCDAQIWCPPGATWTYEALNDQGGFVRMMYTGDTLINGEVAQKIDQLSATQGAGGGEATYTYTPVARITKVQDDVVYLRGGQSWDTLYWFGATPGHGYTRPFSSCSPFMILANGSDVYNGVPLNWYSIGSIHRIYERMGYTWHLSLECPGNIILTPAALRCYSDEEISVQLTTQDCEALVRVNEVQRNAIGSAYPSPGTDGFTLRNASGDETLLVLLDATGREVLRMQPDRGNSFVDCSSLGAGIYTYRMHERNPERVHVGRWVKE